MTTTGLSKFAFLRMTLVACVGIIIASNALAQNPPPPPPPPTGAGPAPPPTEVERVIVTGSNIPTAETVGPNPVDTYNRENITKSGEITTEQFLLSLPVVNANVVPISNNENGSNTAVGAATIALHGFDARATLILIDGRRVAPYPTGNNPGLVNVMFVDLNSIPQAAIESIEILKDSASTTYGADAVAGVVNLKMRHNYDGAESRVEYGNTLDKDSGLFDAYGIFGVGKGDTNITGVLNYYHRNSIANRDRGFSAVPPFLSGNTSPYNLQLSSDVAGAAGGQNLNPGGIEFSSPPDLTNGLAPASAYLYSPSRVRGAGGIRPGFNFNLFALSFPASERWGGYTGFRYSQLKNVQTGQQVSASLFNRILNAADPIFDPNSPQFIGTTIPFNPFGDFHVPIPSNQATVDFARVHPKDEDISKIATVDGTVYTTSLFELPAGGIGFAFGGQFRREPLKDTPDSLILAGDIIGNATIPAA